MVPWAFIGGAITGATGLVAVALWDGKRTESAFSPVLKNPGILDAEETVKQLNAYFLKAQDVYGKCNEIMLKVIDLISTPIELPDDGLVQKAENFIGGKANLLCRRFRESELLNVKKEMGDLFRRYKGVFERANALIAEKGLLTVDLSNLLLPAEVAKIDNSLENDNWNFEMWELADVITGFIENSCNVAENLIQLLEKSE